MRLSVATLCDAATVREGLLHILGGGITQVWRESFPSPLGGALVVGFLARLEDLQPHVISVSVSGPDENHVQMRLTMDGDALRVLAESNPTPISIPIVLPMTPVVLTTPGEHSIDISLNDEELLSLPFVVHQGSPPVVASPGQRARGVKKAGARKAGAKKIGAKKIGAVAKRPSPRR